MIFPRSCTRRPEAALVIRPKLLELLRATGCPNWVWLKRLKASIPIWKDVRSVILVSFCSEKSKLLIPGPCSELRRVFPYWPQTAALVGRPPENVQLGTRLKLLGSNQKFCLPLKVELRGSSVRTVLTTWFGLSGHP